MRASHRLLAALGSALILSASSSPANVVEGVGTYAKDRFHDTLDIFRLRAGFPDDGKAIGAKARVTSPT